MKYPVIISHYTLRAKIYKGVVAMIDSFFHDEITMRVAIKKTQPHRRKSPNQDNCNRCYYEGVKFGDKQPIWLERIKIKAK